jgi:hypothetical protein
MPTLFLFFFSEHGVAQHYSSLPPHPSPCPQFRLLHVCARPAEGTDSPPRAHPQRKAPMSHPHPPSPKSGGFGPFQKKSPRALSTSKKIGGIFWGHGKSTFQSATRRLPSDTFCPIVHARMHFQFSCRMTMCFFPRHGVFFLRSISQLGPGPTEKHDFFFGGPKNIFRDLKIRLIRWISFKIAILTS